MLFRPAVIEPDNGCPATRGTRWRASIVLLFFFCFGAGEISAVAQPPAEGLEVEVLATGLEGPIAIAVGPDGRVFVAERQNGQIRVLENGQLGPQPVATLSAVVSGERGLLGLAVDTELDPEIATHLYAYYTPSPQHAKIVRVILNHDGTVQMETVIDGLPAAASHNGGSLGIGPDRHLYFSIGDLGNPEGTKPVTSLTGRIHRITLDGQVPEDNPWPGRTEFCRGLRNCFGISFLPNSVPTVLFLTDNGTHVDDEVHRVLGGQHLGWPDFQGKSGVLGQIDPLYSWSPTTAPLGIVYYDGELLSDEAGGSLLFGEYVTGRIIKLDLDSDHLGIRRQEVLTDRGPAPVYALAVHLDGSLWFSFGHSIARVVPARSSWIRGDVDGNGRVERGDVAVLLAHLYGGSNLGCRSAADLDSNGRIDAADAVTLWQYLAGELAELPPPFPECGTSSGQRLPCPVHPACP